MNHYDYTTDKTPHLLPLHFPLTTAVSPQGLLVPPATQCSTAHSAHPKTIVHGFCHLQLHNNNSWLLLIREFRSANIANLASAESRSHHQATQKSSQLPSGLGLESRMVFRYLQLGVVSVQFLQQLLGLAHAAAQLRRVLRRGQLAVVRLQDRPHPVTLLPGTAKRVRDKAPHCTPCQNNGETTQG